MAEQRKRDDPLAGLLARTLRQGLDGSVQNCPDAESLAAYFERALPVEEATRFELHFASCDRCQAQLAAMARMDAAGAAAPRPQTAVARLFDWRWLAPAAAALGAVALWVVIRGPQAPPITERQVLTAEQRTPPASAPDAAVAPPASAPATTEGKAPAALDAGARAQDSKDEASQRALVDLPLEPDSVGRANVLKLEPSPAKPASEPLAAPTEKKAVPAEEIAATRQNAKEAEAQAAGQKAELARDEAARPTEQLAALQDQAAPGESRRSAPAAAGALSTNAAPVDSKLRAERARAATGAFSAALASQPVITAPGDRTFWRIGPAGLIERSTDRGKTWHRQASPVQGDLLAGSAPSANVCWIVGKAGIVLRTSDGQSWQQLGSPTGLDLVLVEATDANRATVTTADGKRYATTDAGRTWRSL